MKETHHFQRWLRIGLCSFAALTAACSSATEPAGSCLEGGRWTLTGERVQLDADSTAIIDGLAARAVVLLGEQHDDIDHHRWQLQTLAALHARQPQLQIGFEMFPRRAQPVLDRWVAGELSVADFIREVEWDKVWSMPVELYLPLFQFARINRIPMLALNVDASLTRSIAASGWAAIPSGQREGVGDPAPASAEYRQQLSEIHHFHHQRRSRLQTEAAAEAASAAETKTAAKTAAETEAEALERFIDSQLVWDRAMAEGLQAALLRQPQGLVVGIMGSGHVRHGHGVAHQLRALGVDDIGLALPLAEDTPCTQVTAGMADAVFALPLLPQTPPPPPRLGVHLEAVKEGVKLVEVQAGSLAEHSGLRSGDVIVAAAGKPLTRTLPLVALVRSALPGTWLPLRVVREGTELELVVRFPVDEE